MGYLKNEFIPILKKRNIKIVLQLGDFFNSRKEINTRTLHYIKNYFLRLLQKENIRLIVFAGNHDSFYTDDSSIISVGSIEEFENVTVIRKPTLLQTENNINFSIIPWISNEKEMEEFHTFVKQNPHNIVMGHFEMRDFEMVAGHVNPKGISPAIFQNFKKVISGHYHIKQFKDNIFYLGAPFQFTWNDYNQEKGFYIYNFQKDYLEFFENKNIIYKKIFYKDSEYETLVQDIPSCKDKIIKLIVVEKENDVLFDKFVSELEKTSPTKFDIIDGGIEVNVDNVQTYDETKNLIDVFDDYLKELNHPKHKKIMNVIQTLYKDCVQENKNV